MATVDFSEFSVEELWQLTKDIEREIVRREGKHRDMTGGLGLMGLAEWKRELRHGLRNARDLGQLPLSAKEQEHIAETALTFKVRAPASYLDLIDWNDPSDPIRLQVIPAAEELQWDTRELPDPIGDHTYSPTPRLTHRYPDRVLLYPTYLCAVYCRHCFRKESVNEYEAGFSQTGLEPALNYIAKHDNIYEVILTGGDPLMLSDHQLSWLQKRLEAIPHLRLLRIHTRIPAVLPSRITHGMVVALEGRLMVCIVTHFNHPREITPRAAEACQHLRRAGFMLMNQTVLLKGVNNDVEVLATLFRKLVYVLGAKPYYLHHCDLARGLSHFRTTLDEGLAIMQQLRGHLSGLCQPTYVLDLPTGDGKIPLGPSFVETREAHKWLFRTWQGGQHAYEEVIGGD